MSKRKTIEVKKILEMVNHRNRHSTCSPEIREGWNSLMEEILQANGVYSGFGYLGQEQVPSGQLPGMVKEDNGFIFPDESRRTYYTHYSLQGS